MTWHMSDHEDVFKELCVILLARLTFYRSVLRIHSGNELYNSINYKTAVSHGVITYKN